MIHLTQPQNQTKAAYALQIGRLFCHYDKRMTKSQIEEHHDALITTALLHSLLTACVDLTEDMKVIGVFRHRLSDIPSIWGLTKAMVVRNTFTKTLTHCQVINRVGIALCHPMSGAIHDSYPVSGYSPLFENGLISSYSFVYSPDIRNVGKRPMFTTLEAAEKYRGQIVKEFEREFLYKREAIKDGVPVIKVKRVHKRRFYLVNDDDTPYARIFHIDIPLAELKLMLRGVSNYLAQATQAHWNRRDFRQLVE